MAKATKQFQFNCDYQTYIDFQFVVGKGNVTRSLEEYMVSTIATHNGDFEKIDLKIIDKKIEELTKKQAKITSELQKNTQIKAKIEQKMVKKEEDRLKIESEKIKKQKTCAKCGNEIKENDKKHELPKGLLCNGCFLSMNLQDAEFWMKR